MRDHLYDIRINFITIYIGENLTMILRSKVEIYGTVTLGISAKELNQIVFSVQRKRAFGKYL